jgi:hypothetical protein
MSAQELQAVVPRQFAKAASKPMKAWLTFKYICFGNSCRLALWQRLQRQQHLQQPALLLLVAACPSWLGSSSRLQSRRQRQQQRRAQQSGSA